MEVIDDRNFTLADVSIGQGFTQAGAEFIRIGNESPNCLRLSNVSLQDLPVTTPVSDICNVELHKKRLA